MVAVSGRLEFLFVGIADTSFSHEIPGFVSTNIVTFSSKLRRHSSSTLFAPGLFMDLFDFGNQMKIRPYCFRVFSADGFVVSAPAHSHNITQPGYGISLLMLPDEVVSYIDSLAKKAAAFFRISFSIFSCLFSWRSRMSSSFSEFIFPFPRKACVSSAVSCSFHHLRIPSWMPKLLAASETL